MGFWRPIAMPYFFRCPKCSQQFQVGKNSSGKRFKCPCGTVTTIPAPAREEPHDDIETIPEPPRRAVRRREARPWTRTLLLVLLACYFPFLGFLCLVVGSIAAWLIW